MMRKYIFVCMILVGILLVSCEEITNFEECVKAGNPVMESYPRQCRAGDKTFVEMIQEEVGSELSIDQAMGIAQDSECTEKGILTANYMYNENTKTWWIDLEMKPEFENEICNPACVVSEETKTAEINWRCTGALPPEE